MARLLVVTSEDEQSFFEFFSRDTNLFEFRPLSALSLQDVSFFDCILLQHRSIDVTNILLDAYQSVGQSIPLLLLLEDDAYHFDLRASDFIYRSASPLELNLRIDRLVALSTAPSDAGRSTNAASTQNGADTSGYTHALAPSTAVQNNLPLGSQTTDAGAPDSAPLGLKFNASGFGISVDGVPVALTFREFELFSILAKNPRKVIRREEIMQKIWGEESTDSSRVIDVHIRRIRSKLGPNYARKVNTIRSVGYTYQDM